MHRSVRDSLARVGRWPRLLAAAACLLLAGVSAVGATHSAPKAVQAPVRTVPVVVAGRDLPAGRDLTARDLLVAQWPPAVRPSGAAARLGVRVGSRLAGPLRSGEPVTATRLVGASLTDGLAPGLAAVPIAVTQPQAVDLVHAGGFVELVATPQDALGPDPTTGVTGSPQPASTGSGSDATVLARRLLVLAVLPASNDDLASDDTASIVVAADPATALDIARAQIIGVVLALPVSP